MTHTPWLPQAKVWHMLIVAAVAAGVRIWLMALFPIIFGGDSMTRLLHRDQILMAHQLPLLQLCLYLLNRLSPNLVLVRGLMIGISIIATEGVYLLTELFAGARGAFVAALLFGTSPFITAVSIVPYQEILMVAFLLFACYFLAENRPVAASMCLGLACFSRYEAWVACPVMAWAYVRSAPGFRRIAKGIVLFGWAPVIWMFWQGGLSQQGSFVIDHAITLRRLWRLVYIAGITARETPIPVLILVGIAAYFIARGGGLRTWPVRMACVFTGLFGVALLFSAHGDAPDPERLITSREAYIPITILTILSGAAAARYRRAGLILCATGVLLGAFGAWQYIRHETSRPEIRLGYEAARYLDAHTEPTGNVLILARPIPESSLQLYLDKARKAGGPRAEAGARRILADADPSPPDFQRFRVHSVLGRDRIFAFPRYPEKFDWIVAWSDFLPPDTRSAEWRRVAFTRPEKVFTCQGTSVAVYRMP